MKRIVFDREIIISSLIKCCIYNLRSKNDNLKISKN